jgi:PAS domain S-box-containing protein
VLFNPASLTDVERQIPSLAPGFKRGFRSFMAVPLSSNQMVLGTLHWQSIQGNAYTQRHLALAEQIGAQFSIALANDQLQSDLERGAREQALVSEVVRILSSSHDVGSMFDEFSQQVSKVVPFDRMAISIVAPDNRTLTQPYVTGTDVAGWGPMDERQLEGTATEAIIQTREGICIGANEIEEMLELFPDLNLGTEFGFGSLLAVPLIADDRVLGSLEFRSTEPMCYTASDMAVMERVAGQLAGAISNAKLLTEQQKAEQALRESQGRYRLLAENVADVIWVRDLDMNLMYISPSVERLRGFTAAEMMEVPVEDSFPSGTLGLIQQELRRQLDLEAQSYDVDRARITEAEVTRKDGSTVWTETTMKFLRYADGRPASVLGVARDITERRSTEQHLRLNTAALESAANAVTIADADGAVIWVNPAFTALTGYAAGDIIGQRVEILNTDSNPADFYRGLRETVYSGRVWRGELSNQRKDGTEYMAELTITPVKSADGTITHFVGIEQDITQRKNAEDAVIEAEEKYRTLVENANAAILVTVGDKIVYRNDAYDSLIGFTPDSSKRDSFLGSVAKEHRALVMEHYEARLRGDEAPEQYEIDLVTHSGDVVSVEIRPRVIEYGGEQAVMVVMRDITERKLLVQQLFQSQKMESVGQLAGGVAHDFNNLLSAVIGFAQLASMQVSSTGRVDSTYLDEIQSAAQRGADLTRQLLAFSRIQGTEPKIVGMNDLIINLQKMAKMDSVKADPGQMEQVLTNLAVNARDAMPTGGKLSIQTTNIIFGNEIAKMDPELKPGPYVQVTVTDVGVGMPSNVASRIFEPFFTTKGIGEGTGLGLSTCYGIVKQHKGHIVVDSEIGLGTTFTIYIPAIAETADLQSSPDEPFEFQRGTETVLLVEDEPAVRKLTAEVLEQQGYTVISAISGREAARVLEEPGLDEIDLLLTDVVMPMMGGRELAERFKLSYPEGKVIYMSGYPSATQPDADYLRSQSGFMQKPVTMSELTRKVRQTLDAAE